MEYTGQARSEVTGDTYAHFISTNKNDLDSHIELVEVSNQSPLVKAGLDQEGISHIAYRVEDVGLSLEDLEAAGSEIVLEPTVIEDITFAYAGVKDGYVFEVMEFPEKYDNSYEI